MKGEALWARPCIRGRTGMLELKPKVSECAVSGARAAREPAAMSEPTAQARLPRGAGLKRCKDVVAECAALRAMASSSPPRIRTGRIDDRDRLLMRVRSASPPPAPARGSSWRLRLLVRVGRRDLDREIARGAGLDGGPSRSPEG